MSIKLAIREALRSGPKSVLELASITGHDVASIRNARGYLQADGIIRQVAGQKATSANMVYELTPIKAPPTQVNRLTLPEWVPPKTLHRPTFHAPGMIVREKLTNRVLA